MPITVLNPTFQSDTTSVRIAKPLASIDGALIGVLSNSKFNTDRLFEYVERALKEQHGAREVVWRTKHDFSRPAPASMLAELSACDAIITGVGD